VVQRRGLTVNVTADALADGGASAATAPRPRWTQY
jgi:hypothetical protein